MPQGINASARLLGAISPNFLSSAVAGGPSAPTKALVSRDRVQLSHAAGNNSVEQQIKALDAKASGLQANRDNVLGDIRAIFVKLNSDNAKVRGLQGQIDGLEAQRKALLKKAVLADKSTISSIDQQIAALEAQKASTQKDLVSLEKLGKQQTP